MAKDQRREALQALCEVRLAAQRQAEQALAHAAVELGRAQDLQARLAQALNAAQARVAAARDPGAAGATAAAMQRRQLYLGRLQAEAQAAQRELEAHVQGPLRAASDAEARARDQHLRACRRREVVERAIARREATRRREQDRRAEAAADDLASQRAGRRGRS